MSKFHSKAICMRLKILHNDTQGSHFNVLEPIRVLPLGSLMVLTMLFAAVSRSNILVPMKMYSDTFTAAKGASTTKLSLAFLSFFCGP
jgi:hypothetical protein